MIAKLNRSLTIILIGMIIYFLVDKVRKNKESNEVNNFKSVASDSLIVGKKYLHCYNLNSKNPFVKVNCDSIKILKIKNGYVQYEFINGKIIDSESINWLLTRIKR